MALPAFRAAGAKGQGTTGEVEVPAPSGVATGDLELLVATTIAGGSVSIKNNGGGAWTAVEGSPKDVTGGEKLYAWIRQRAGGDGNPKVQAGIDHICAERCAWKVGSYDTAEPLEIASTGSEETSDTSFVYKPEKETAGRDRRCVVIVSSGVDSETGQAGTNTANTSLSGIVMRTEPNTKEGGGGGFWLADGYRATAGTVGEWTQTMTSASPKAYIAFAIRPAAFTDTRYKLKETSGTTVTDDLGANNAEYSGSPSLNQTGIVRSGDACPSFDGTNDQVIMPDLIEEWTEFTCRIFVKPTEKKFYQVIAWAGSTGAPSAWLGESGEIKADMAASEGGTVTLEQTSAYVAEQLLCIHVTYASGRFRLYINGVKKKESTTPKGFVVAGIGRIGTNGGASSGWLKGKLASYRLRDKELSEAEVLEDYELDAPQALKVEPSDSVSLADALSSKAVTLNKADTVALTDSVSKAVGKALADAVALADELVSAGLKKILEFADAVNLADALVKAVGKTATDGAALSDSISKAVAKPTDDSTTLSDAVAKAVGKGLADSAALDDALVKAVGKAPSDSAALDDAVSKAVGKTTGDSAALDDAVSKALGLGKADSATLSDAVAKAIGLGKDDSVSLADSASTFIKGAFVRVASFGDESFAAITALEADATIGEIVVAAVVSALSSGLDLPALDSDGVEIAPVDSGALIDSETSEATHP